MPRSTSRNGPTRSPAPARCWCACMPPASTAPTSCKRAGRYPPPPGVPDDMPGMELAGEVAAVGPGATRFSLGERVMAIVAGAAQAEYAVVHERILMPVPESLSWPQAGAVPEVFTTAHDALFTQGQLVAGERLLVHGAAGGVGTAAVQLGRAAGAQVTATVRNPDHRGEVAVLGATVLAPEEFLELADGPGPAGPGPAQAAAPFDVILELVGAPNMPAKPPRPEHRRPHLRDRHRRRRAGGGPPRRADGQARADPRLDVTPRARWSRRRWQPGRWSAVCCRCSPAVRSRCRSRRPSR